MDQELRVLQKLKTLRQCITQLANYTRTKEAKTISERRTLRSDIFGNNLIDRIVSRTYGLRRLKMSTKPQVTRMKSFLKHNALTDLTVPPYHHRPPPLLQNFAHSVQMRSWALKDFVQLSCNRRPSWRNNVWPSCAL